MTWLPEGQRLRVQFATRLTNGLYRTIDIPRPASTLPPKERERRHVKTVRYGTSFGAELGMAYEVNHLGKLEKTEPLPLSTFQKEIPPPIMSKRLRQAADLAPKQAA